MVVSVRVWSALPDQVITDTGVDGRVAGTVPRRPGNLLVGVVTAAAGLLLPDPVVAAYLVGLVNPAVLVGCAFPFLWSRKWRRKSEDDS
ncbi:hypothetical protein [Nocardiopsis alkaliphila]|uniref:hypothetical protein n=1 Tax=Nocardiopsis alkaliphila TaxID=225762 RepID=UPI001267F8F5|nr:hypothetical protein [Nocardiopsis alkaliphila]